jgi:tetratricopeptide (TPR) repeat protein
MVGRWNARFTRLVVAAVIAGAAAVMGHPVYAQGGMARGVVRDDGGKPIEGVTVVIEPVGSSGRRYEIKTNRSGEYFQIGLTSGAYTVTASMDALKTQPTSITVRMGQTATADFVLPLNAAAAAVAAKGRAAEVKRLFDEGVAATTAGRYDEAIAKFTEGATVSPDCFDCYNRIAYVHIQRKQYAEAEAAYKKAIEIRPENPMAYSGLATVYSSTGKTDLAEQASAKAIELLGTSSAGAGGGGAEASYNQGVIFLNQGKTPEAKEAFQRAIQADANHAESHYQLGMLLIGQNEMAGALSELQTYLKLAPDGKNAAMAKGAVTELEKLQK